MPITLNPVVTAPYDLATATFVANALAAGGKTLSAAETAILGPLITAASKEMQRFMGRGIPLATYREGVTPEGGRPDGGEPASAKLSQFPVQAIASVRTGRTAALVVSNVDPATHQFA